MNPTLEVGLPKLLQFEFLLCYNNCMKIEWNKVTWYSRIFAIIVIGFLPLVGFYLGVVYERTVSQTEAEQFGKLGIGLPAYPKERIAAPLALPPIPALKAEIETDFEDRTLGN